MTVRMIRKSPRVLRSMGTKSKRNQDSSVGWRRLISWTRKSETEFVTEEEIHQLRGQCRKEVRVRAQVCRASTGGSTSGNRSLGMSNRKRLGVAVRKRGGRCKDLSRQSYTAQPEGTAPAIESFSDLERIIKTTHKAGQGLRTMDVVGCVSEREPRSNSGFGGPRRLMKVPNKKDGH